MNIFGFSGHKQSRLYIFLLFSHSSCGGYSGDDGWYSSFCFSFLHFLFLPLLHHYFLLFEVVNTTLSSGT